MKILQIYIPKKSKRSAESAGRFTFFTKTYFKKFCITPHLFAKK